MTGRKQDRRGREIQRWIEGDRQPASEVISVFFCTKFHVVFSVSKRSLTIFAPACMQGRKKIKQRVVGERKMEHKAKNIKAFSGLCALIFI